MPGVLLHKLNDFLYRLGGGKAKRVLIERIKIRLRSFLAGDWLLVKKDCFTATGLD